MADRAGLELAEVDVFGFGHPDHDNQIDVPIGQVRVGVHTVWINGEYGNPTPLERILVDRIVVCWLQLQQVDNLASQIDALSAKTGP